MMVDLLVVVLVVAQVKWVVDLLLVRTVEKVLQ
jgi:hypothetical protein